MAKYSETRLVWRTMLLNAKKWDIEVCPTWQDFETFLNDLGEKPEGARFHRFQGVGPYSKDNCYWAMPITDKRTYNSWRSTFERCYNPKNARYDSYGARGITVCERWRKAFKFFLEDMGPRPKHCSLDRIDINKNYDPSNCRWASNEVQVYNKQNTRFLTNGKERINVNDFKKRFNLKKTIADRPNRKRQRTLYESAGKKRPLRDWLLVHGYEFENSEMSD